MENQISQSILEMANLPLDERVTAINEIKLLLHSISPFKNEPVDCVVWVKNDSVFANDYNPNKVAPPEMELLEISIMNDGYTQPIVTWQNDESERTEVIDGFHRSRVGKESKLVKQRVMGYLPVVKIRKEQTDKNDRIASTIRHNRARGKHQVDAMSEIVIELKNRNWTNTRIARELGMDEEEVLRLCQISGLEHLFNDSDFSKAWESSEVVSEYENLDDINDDEVMMYRTANTSDKNRIFHTFDKWECHKAGFYNSQKVGFNHEQCESEFVRIMRNHTLFAEILEKVITEWVHSCEHYLTNTAMNRIAWLGQAAVCYYSRIPSRFSSAWQNLTTEEQNQANEIALKYLNIWLKKYNMEEVDMNEALSLGRQVEIY